MRIPTNSNFSTEIAKKFKQIFHRDMTLGGLQDLQDELNLINPVDTYLQKQVSHLEKNNEPKTNVQGSRTARQEKTNGERFVTKVVKEQRTAEEFGF
jgi:SpoU rRNA methylase family enzyme